MKSTILFEMFSRNFNDTSWFNIALTFEILAICFVSPLVCFILHKIIKYIKKWIIENRKWPFWAWRWQLPFWDFNHLLNTILRATYHWLNLPPGRLGHQSPKDVQWRTCALGIQEFTLPASQAPQLFVPRRLASNGKQSWGRLPHQFLYFLRIQNVQY
jgi:hypothetical protein